MADVTRIAVRPPPSSDGASRRLGQHKSRDTTPELAVRRALFASGLRYRVHYPVPGRTRGSIDIAFPALRVAVFVDGCFWHGCEDHARPSKSNSNWWASKISANRERDASTSSLLEELGWTVIRCWEHEAPAEVANRVRSVVAQKRRAAAQRL